MGDVSNLNNGVSDHSSLFIFTLFLNQHIMINYIIIQSNNVGRFQMGTDSDCSLCSQLHLYSKST